MYKGKIVSVVMATYRDKETIGQVIKKYFATGLVDEVVVVNNNAEPGTREEVKKTSARMVYEKRQGYGFAFKKALMEAEGDYIIVTEPDGSFEETDIERFLAYSKDFDVVFGSRTCQVKFFSKAEMGTLRRLANVFEAKTIEIIFNTNSLTDVGCTYKFFKKEAINKISPFWKTKGSPLFNTELILLTIVHKLKFVEIPISYKKRKGKSSIVGSWHKLVKWGFLIQFYIFYFYLSWIFLKIKNKLFNKNN